jgi:hypothetical protein
MQFQNWGYKLTNDSKELRQLVAVEIVNEKLENVIQSFDEVLS